MKSLLFISISLYFCIPSHAQAHSNYQSLIAKASLFHLQEDFRRAIGCYEKAFQIQQPDASTAYKAAGMYSLDSNADKAFQYLELALSLGWTETDWLAFDPYFDYLRNKETDKWSEIEKQAFAREQHYERTLQFPALRREINLMTLEDQKLRYKRAQNTNDSMAVIFNQHIQQSDLSHLEKVKQVITQYGWPKISEIGKDGQNNLWLLVQHADQDVIFQKTALVAMEKLKGTRELNMENYAFLYDRVQCNLNYKQLYGTQVVWTNKGEASAFRPMSKEYLVDKRRRKLGLQPLHVYSQTYGFSYSGITKLESTKKDADYSLRVQNLMDAAKKAYAAREFQKTYDYYNTASTFLGGMSDRDNLEAAVIFSTIASNTNDGQYRSIALDFLNLLSLRESLTRKQLLTQPAFEVLHEEQRWIDMIHVL